MGRKGITSADVVQAYVALLKQGRKPGPINLRLQLGRGSFTTISGHLRRLALPEVALQAQKTSEVSKVHSVGDTRPHRTLLERTKAEEDIRR